MTKRIGLVFCVLCAISSLASADTKLHKKLHNVQTKIDSTQKALHTDQKKQAHLQKKLRDFELSISQLENQLSETQKKLSEKKQEIAELQQEQKKRTQQYELQKTQLSTLMKRFYRFQLEHNNALKNALNSDDSRQHERVTIYQHHLQADIQHKLQHLNASKSALESARVSLLDETKELAELRDQLIKQQTLISEHHHDRQKVLALLDCKIKSELHTLTELNNNKQRLATLLKKLQQTKQSNAAYFVAHQHKMPWPAEGPITRKFGDAIAQSTLKSNGVVIQATDKSPVKAIAGGTVVFDEWMRGFGLLVIIDHGGGFMSIYGHNSSILTKVGKQVSPGEIIANVGSSGGLANPELYFSIRHNGKPLDPSQWCS